MSPVVRNGRRERSEFEVPLLGEPSGPVVRRQASEAELAAWRAKTPPPVLPKPAITVRQTEAQRLVSSRRGGEATRQKHPWRAGLITVADPPVIPAAEEPVMPEPSSSHARDDLFEALAIHADAVTEALEAREVLLAAEQRWSSAREALIASYRGAGLLAVQGDYPVDAVAELRKLVHDEARASVALDVTAQSDWRGKPIPPAPAESPAHDAETIPVAAPIVATGGPGRAPYVQRMLDALVAVDGDFTAAARGLGVKRTSLVGSMSKLRARTDLTEAERAAVARKRGGS